MLITDVPKSSTDVPLRGAIPRLPRMLSLRAQEHHDLVFFLTGFVVTEAELNVT